MTASPTEFYTPEEIDLLRQQLRNGCKEAAEAARRRGYTIHPRVAAIKRHPPRHSRGKIAPNVGPGTEVVEP